MQIGQGFHVVDIRFSVWRGWEAATAERRWGGALADQFIVPGSWPNGALPRGVSARDAVALDDDGAVVAPSWLASYTAQWLVRCVRAAYGIADEYPVRIDAATLRGRGLA